jgi:hypothetical protein
MAPRQPSQQQSDRLEKRIKGEYVPPPPTQTSTADLIKAIWS